MVEGEQDNPLFLRQVMENYKLKVSIDGMEGGRQEEEWKVRGGRKNGGERGGGMNGRKKGGEGGGMNGRKKGGEGG